MTWSTLVLSQSPLKVEVVGTLGIRLVFYIIPSILFLLFDSVIPSLSVGIKRQGGRALPTRTGGIRVSRSKAPQWYSVVGISLFNILLGVGIQAGIEALLTKVLHVRSALKITTTLPMPWSIAKDALKCLLMREYYSHRYILHARTPNILSRRHKAYFHSLKSPYSFCAHYDHPTSYILFRFLPVYLPSVILRAHLLTHLVVLSIVTLEETLSVSGYSTIPGIILGGIARRQDMHSASLGAGNFAPWGLLDWIHGTSIGRGVEEDIADEAEKHQIKQRGNKAISNGKEGMRSWAAKRKSAKKT
ncbi:hypothetical protein ACMFMG_008961 [Clarireedia jacksonii]